MQANLGLYPGVGQPTMAGPIKSPAQVAAELSAQATANLQYGATIGPQVARNLPQMQAFGQQFQQQYSAAQSMQSFNPYMANMMGGAMGGTQQMNLPSPIMMTPSNMGVFRPPSQSQNYAPIPPMYTPPLIQMQPFTPQMTRPMFQTAWDQEMKYRDYRADAIYSYSMQAPRVGGNMAGYGVGAIAGAAMGGRMGSPLLGAAMGMIGAGVSGLSGGMGDLAMIPFRPQIEARQMGASIQNMSQNFVVGGSQLHQSGMGLTRGASRQLATGIMDMVDSSSFQKQTGGMFSRGDMMSMLSTGGQSGLMDFAQNTDQIKEQLRKTAMSVKKFMELTNDPDMNNLVRRMASMQRMGFSMGDMDMAAGNLRRFSRGAGTSIAGITESGNAGAMVYQGMGLSAASGMNFGMFSAMAARQAVASGVFNPAELALRGGTSGIAQRNMQAQAAMMSMPLVGASMSSFQNGSWGVNYGQMANQMSGNGGAAGFVRGAANNLNRAALSGGVGAIALYGLQSQGMNDEISRSMSPEQQMAMRFNSALKLGESMGLKGAGAFAVGAQKMFGKEIAQDMLPLAASPEFWKSLRKNDNTARQELARQQYQDIKDRTPGMWDDVKRTVGNAFGSGGGSGLARSIGQFSKRWSDDTKREEAAERGDYYYSETAYDGLSKGQIDAWSSRTRGRGAGQFTQTPTVGSGTRAKDTWRDATYMDRRANNGQMGWREMVNRVASPLASVGIGLATRGVGFAASMVGIDVNYGMTENVGGFLMQQNMTPAEERRAHQAAMEARKEDVALFDASKKNNIFSTSKKDLATKAQIAKTLGVDSTKFLMGLGSDVASYAQDQYNRVGPNGQIMGDTVKKLGIRKLLASRPDLKNDWNAAEKLYSTLGDDARAMIEGGSLAYGSKVTGAKGANIIATGEKEARIGSGMANLEDAKVKIQQTKDLIDDTGSALLGGGIFGNDSSELQNALLGKTLAQQTAMGMVFGGQEVTDKEMSTLKSRLRRDNPKATDEQIDALANKTLQEVSENKNEKGEQMFTPEAIEQLFRAGTTIRGRNEKFKTTGTLGTALENISNLQDSNIKLLSEAGTSDFMGKGFLGGNNLGDITETDIAALEKAGNVSQAKAAREFMAAKKGGSKEQMDLAQSRYDKAGVAAMTVRGGAAESQLVASGPEANNLEGSSAAIDAIAATMEKAFANFTPNTTANFANGSQALFNAMKLFAEDQNKARPIPKPED
jgi:hypothetical protein